MAQFWPAHRLTIFLPVNDQREQLAAARVVLAVRGMFGAATQTKFDPPPMIGYWLDGDVLYTDEIALVYVDVDPEGLSADIFEASLSHLRANIFSVDAEVDSPQAEVWIEVDGIQVYRNHAS